MLKRAIPLLILFGLGGFGAYRIWRFNEPNRRFARIDDLLHTYQDKPHGAWTKEDRAELWRHVTWFNLRHRNGFVDRIVARIGSDDADERYRAVVLASHIDTYSALNGGTLVIVYPWLLPLPDPRSDRLSDFRFRDVPKAHPEAFARLADDPREPVRLSFVYLAEASDAPALRDAFIRLVSRECTQEEIYFAVYSLGACEGDPIATRALASLAESGAILARFEAATALAFGGHPAGSRLFVDLLTDLENDLSRLERVSGCDRLSCRLVSLEPLREDTSWAMDQGMAVLEDVFRHWRSWLEIREHEDFRADAQAARDDAWAGAHP